MSTSSDELPADAPRPRQCHLFKWPDFDGYGFNLHAEKTKSGQYIGKVDEDSPAEAAGLCEGDRIIEVNDVNVSNENHRQVVERIKSISNETKLLVITDEGDNWYKERKIVIKSSLPNVEYLKTPVPRSSSNNKAINGTANSTTSTDEDGNSVASASPKQSPKDSPKVQTPSKTDNINNNITALEQVTISAPSPSVTPEPKSNGTPEPKSNGTPAPVSPAATSNGLNLNMTAQEMRQRLASRKKRDPKQESLDARKKYEIIQSM